MYVDSSEHERTSLKEVKEWVSKGVEVREGKFKGFEAASYIISMAEFCKCTYSRQKLIYAHNY